MNDTDNLDLVITTLDKCRSSIWKKTVNHDSAQDTVRSLWLSVESGSSRFKLRVLRNPWFLMILAMLSPLNRSSYTYSAGCALDWLIRLIAERERVMWSPINTSGYCADVGRFRWIVGLLIQLRRKKFCWVSRLRTNSLRIAPFGGLYSSIRMIFIHKACFTSREWSLDTRCELR